MKRQETGWIPHWLGCSLLAAALGLAATLGAARATTLSLSQASVPAGGSVSVTVSDPSFDPTLLGIDVTVLFDPTVLAFNSASLGSWLPNALLFTSSPSSGTASVSICCDFTGGSGDSLFSVAFDVSPTAGAGLTTISFATADFAVGNPFEYQLNPSPISIDLQITAPTGVTPLPPAGMLLLTGLGLFALVRRRATRHSSSEAIA